MSVGFTSASSRAIVRLLIGSTTTTLRAESAHDVVHRHQMLLQPLQRRAGRVNFAAALFTHGSRSMPMERMLRTICAVDSS